MIMMTMMMMSSGFDICKDSDSRHIDSCYSDDEESFLVLLIMLMMVLMVVTKVKIKISKRNSCTNRIALCIVFLK